MYIASKKEIGIRFVELVNQRDKLEQFQWFISVVSWIVEKNWKSEENYSHFADVCEIIMEKTIIANGTNIRDSTMFTQTARFL